MAKGAVANASLKRATPIPDVATPRPPSEDGSAQSIASKWLPGCAAYALGAQTLGLHALTQSLDAVHLGFQPTSAVLAAADFS